MIMKRLISVVIAGLMLVGAVHATGGKPPTPSPGDIIKIDNNLVQRVNVVGGDAISVAEGGDADADSVAASNASVNTTTNYKTRTSPITTFPASLPYWNHGGWGTIKAYFPNGRNEDDHVYERTFDPASAIDKRQLRGVLESLPHDGPLEFLGGILNGVGAVFCGVDNYHHGRGFEIANSLVRERRRKGAPLLVFIDTNVDTNLLREAGYAYVGKVSLEGNVNRNWDQVYDAAVAETLPWDVDVLLVSGGMKGVTVGSTTAFPGAGGAYSQTNYSLSAFGSVSTGITEGKGKAVLSAQAYRFSPAAVKRTKIPQSFYDRIRAGARPTPTLTPKPMPKPTPRPTSRRSSVESTQRISAPAIRREVKRVAAAPRMRAPVTSVKRATRRLRTAQEPLSVTKKRNVAAGVEVSKTLWEMAAFDKNQMVDYVIIR